MFKHLIGIALVVLLFWGPAYAGEGFAKPDRQACEAKGGKWGLDGKDECWGTWSQAQQICSLPSIEQWRDAMKECGTDRGSSSFQQCISGRGYTNSSYWSATSFTYSADNAFTMNPFAGEYNYPKAAGYWIRCAQKTTAPSGRFFKPERAICEARGGKWGVDGKDECLATWTQAASICKLPTIQQWRTMVKGCDGAPGNSSYHQCINGQGYTNASYWSATNFTHSADNAFTMNPHAGEYNYPKNAAYWVRCSEK